ncbi:MAG TPA: hypothetical protein VN028_02770 [Rhodocyclaceae bacterium]|nr:hypothetical protein [Rhodocyclaceae bacterium]
MEALLLIFDVVCFSLLLLAVKRKENAANPRQGLGLFAYRSSPGRASAAPESEQERPHA